MYFIIIHMCNANKSLKLSPQKYFVELRAIRKISCQVALDVTNMLLNAYIYSYQLKPLPLRFNLMNW